MNKTKALFIVEGQVAEKILVNSLVCHLGQLASLNVQIVSVSANIHMLYQKLKDNDFFLDIVQTISELEGISENEKLLLSTEGPYAYKYLVFDLDLHHYDIEKADNIHKGLNEVEEMLSYFSDETDDCGGKLYINYPMIESYRDCRSFFDEDYANRIIEVNRCSQYKRIVGERGNSKNINSYAYDDFVDLICMNLYKANWIINHEWKKQEYKQYKDSIRTNELFKKEKEAIIKDRIIKVINTLLFFPVDYFGNTHGYFDHLRPR